MKEYLELKMISGEIARGGCSTREELIPRVARRRCPSDKRSYDKAQNLLSLLAPVTLSISDGLFAEIRRFGPCVQSGTKHAEILGT